MNLIFFDLETTGLSKTYNDIIDIAAISYNEEESCIIDIFHTFVKPEKPINWQITQLTGITNEMVVNSPIESLALIDFNNWITKQNAEYCIGHNIIRFDYPFIEEKCNKYTIINKLPKNKLDTLNMAKEAYAHGKLPNYNFTTEKGNLSFKQEYLMQYYNFGVQTHTALDDVKNDILIYQELKKSIDDIDYGF